jgi:hypothetical protein
MTTTDDVLQNEIKAKIQQIEDDEAKITLLKDNVSRNKKILKILDPSNVKLKAVKKEDGNTQ